MSRDEASFAQVPFTGIDDSGRIRPSSDSAEARRHARAELPTELVYAAGGGAALVGTTALSDFPPAGAARSRASATRRLDVERVLALRPDLVIVFQRGATSRELAQLEAAGVRLFHLEPRRLDDVARAVERLGVVLATKR